MPPSARAVRPLRVDPDRVDRVERALRALRVDGVRPDGLLPVRTEPVVAAAAVKLGAGAAPVCARPHVSQ